MSAARHPLSEELELYVLGALDAQSAARLERHVRRCSPCAAALAEEARLETTLRALVPAVRRAPARVVPLPVPPPPARRQRTGWSGALVAAAAGLLCVWGFGTQHRVSTGETAVVVGEGLVCEAEGPVCPWPSVMASMAPSTPVEGADICRMPASCPIQSRMP